MNSIAVCVVVSIGVNLVINIIIHNSFLAWFYKDFSEYEEKTIQGIWNYMEKKIRNFTDCFKGEER